MKPMPYIGLFLIIAYAVVLLPYYFNGSLINFLFYSINNAAHMGIILCGVKIIQDVTEYEDEIIFRKLSIIGIIGLLSCNFGYFLENNNHFQLFHFIFLTSCLISMIKCFFILRKAVKEKGLEKNFIVAIIILTFISIFEVFPITNGNILLVFKLRLIASIFLPFAISTFPALVFVKSMHNYDLKQAEVESLTLEKQAILETQN